MPMGHTDRATINERRPLTRSMRAMLDRIAANEPKGLVWGTLGTPDKNVVRALRDRGLVTLDDAIVRTPEGRKINADRF